MRRTGRHGSGRRSATCPRARPGALRRVPLARPADRFGARRRGLPVKERRSLPGPWPAAWFLRLPAAGRWRGREGCRWRRFSSGRAAEQRSATRSKTSAMFAPEHRKGQQQRANEGWWLELPRRTRCAATECGSHGLAGALNASRQPAERSLAKDLSYTHAALPSEQRLGAGDSYRTHLTSLAADRNAVAVARAPLARSHSPSHTLALVPLQWLPSRQLAARRRRMRSAGLQPSLALSRIAARLPQTQSAQAVLLCRT